MGSTSPVPEKCCCAVFMLTCPLILVTVVDQNDRGTRVRTLVSFIETALVWASNNSSEAPVLMVAWQFFHSPDRGREMMV